MVRNTSNISSDEWNKKPSNHLKSSKKKVNDDLSVVLKQAKKIDEPVEELDNDDDLFDKIEWKTPQERLLNAMRAFIDEEINPIIEWVKWILEDSLTLGQKKYLKSLILSNLEDNIEKMSVIINFFTKYEGILFSFDELVQLFYMDLDEKKLKNLVRLDEEEICKIPDFIDYNLNSEVLSNNITNKLIKLKEIAFEYGEDWILNLDLLEKDFILLRNIKLSDQLIEQIEFLLENDVHFNIKDIVSISKKGIDEEIRTKIEKLSGKMIMRYHATHYLENLEIDEDLIKKLYLFKKLGVPIYLFDLPVLKNRQFSNEDIKKIEHVLSLSENTIYRLEDIKHILSLEYEDIDRVSEVVKKLWIENVTPRALKQLNKIPEEVLQYCIENEISELEDIVKVKAMYSVSNRRHLKEYIQRKKEYLEENKTLSDEKYIEYFWWKWKFSKYEIKQWNIWLCYLYSWLEMLKKMNGFDVLIQTNFIEKKDGWLVRYPFNTWEWIKVNKNEIDKEYEIPEERWGMRKMNINSISDYLWFKILEIAYIKKRAIDNKLWWKKWVWKTEKPYDIEINWKIVKGAEWWDTIITLQELIPENSVVKWVVYPNSVNNLLERLTEIRAPETLIENQVKVCKKAMNRIDKAFDLFWTWFITIELSVPSHEIPQWEWIHIIKIEDKRLAIDNVKILDKQWNEIKNEDTRKYADTFTLKWEKKVVIMTNHAYSVEKCYTNEKWEKRVWVINPWHTDIKFDMSLEQCKKIFRREFWVINIDNLFR